MRKATFLPLLTIVLLAQDNAPEVLLWPGGAPGSEGKTTKEIVTDRPGKTGPFRTVSNIHYPSLTVYLPDKEKATGAAVIVAPGGGHQFLSIEHEGHAVGKWLSSVGIAGFVLKYRLAREEGSTYKVDVHAYQDGQRAIRLIRSRAKEWGVDASRIGFMGFSAGGAVATLAGTRFDKGIENAADPVERQPSRPDFLALVYGGGRPDRLNITADTPPSFLLSASDDEGPSRNNLEVYAALKKAGVPVELHIFTAGGHGFGMRNRPVPITGWPSRLQEWMADRGFLKTSHRQDGSK